MRLGKVHIDTKYVVDLDDQDMVDAAKDALYEDLMNAVKYDELHLWIKCSEDNEATPQDIPEFLVENKQEDLWE